MDQYIRYHKKPYAKYLDVQSFNDKYGTNIKEVEDFDLYFNYTFATNRKKQGPADFLMANFMNHDQFIEFMAKGDKSDKGKKEVKKKKSLWKGLMGKIKKAKDDVKKGLKDIGKETDKGISKMPTLNPLGEQPEIPEVKPEVNDLDGLLSDNEEDMVEAEYDEETPETKEVAATPAPVKNIVTEKKKIADLVLKTSKDSAEYSQDMKHLIQFKSTKLPLEEQLMKGRPKYLKALKAYLKGNSNVEVKMSWKKGKAKMVKVADLNPRRDSLKALLRSSPSGLRVVECV